MNEWIVVAYLLPIGCLWLISQLILTYKTNKDRKKIQHNIRVEKTRKYFAELRLRLLKILADGKLDQKSVTFRFHYSLFTMIMRRPDQYKEISNSLYTAFTSDNTDQEVSGEIGLKLQSEQSQWSDEVKILIVDTIKGLALLVIDYSSKLRLLNTLIKILGFAAIKKFEKQLEEKEASKDPFLKSIYKSQNTLSSLVT